MNTVMNSLSHKCREFLHQLRVTMLCLRSGDTFVITCVANLMEVKALYFQQDLRCEVSSYWRFNV
jgi:hypothetical protein